MRSISAVRTGSAAAVAIASLAFAGLAGTAAQADAAINGSKLKKKSVPANRIKPNSLTGAQINEAKLGLVPVAKLSQFAELAKLADAAKTADSARAAFTADFARNAELARTAEHATTAEQSRTADVAKEAQRVNGRDHTAFLANTVRTVVVQTGQIPTGSSASATVACAASEKAIGGGSAWVYVNSNVPVTGNAQITASMPQPAAAGVNSMTGWRTTGLNSSGANKVLQVYAICVPKTA